jgi:hypothetical protein
MTNIVVILNSPGIYNLIKNNHFINVAVMIFFQLFSSHKINTKVAEQVKNGPIERECRWFD